MRIIKRNAIGSLWGAFGVYIGVYFFLLFVFWIDLGFPSISEIIIKWAAKKIALIFMSTEVVAGYITQYDQAVLAGTEWIKSIEFKYLYIASYIASFLVGTISDLTAKKKGRVHKWFNRFRFRFELKT
jgi:hypothetical protein